MNLRASLCCLLVQNRYGQYPANHREQANIKQIHEKREADGRD